MLFKVIESSDHNLRGKQISICIKDLSALWDHNVSSQILQNLIKEKVIKSPLGRLSYSNPAGSKLIIDYLAQLEQLTLIEEPSFKRKSELDALSKTVVEQHQFTYKPYVTQSNNNWFLLNNDVNWTTARVGNAYTYNITYTAGGNTNRS